MTDESHHASHVNAYVVLFGTSSMRVMKHRNRWWRHQQNHTVDPGCTAVVCMLPSVDMNYISM
jgi:hypothetical protein